MTPLIAEFKGGKAFTAFGEDPTFVDPASLSADIDHVDFLLKGKRLKAEVAEIVTGGEIETTIEGASTLTLNLRDSDKTFLNSQILEDRVALKAVGLDWEFIGVQKQGYDLTVTFEDARVAALRRLKKPAKAARGKVTRAEFIRSQVMKVHRPPIVFVCPELHKKQPILKSQDQESRASKNARRGKGLASKSKLTIKGVKAKPDQLRNLEIALDVAEELGAGERPTLAALVACIQESLCRNLAGGDRDSRGILQVRDSTARPLRINNRDVAQCVRTFLTRGFYGKGGAISLAKKNPSWSVGQIAQNTQGSAFRHAYQPHLKEAKAILTAYGGASGRTKTHLETKKYEFTQGPPKGPRGENTWAMSGRLAEEVGWRRFIVRDRFYYMSEEDLIASRPQMRISEEMDGVSQINFNIDGARNVDQATVECRSRLWQAPPGTVVILEGVGKADGRWLVSSVRRSLFSYDSTIELRRNVSLLPEKGEPAPETRSVSNSSTDSDGSKRGKVIVPSGANRSGVSISRKTMDFFELVAGEYGKSIVVSTGTNHSRLTTSGNVSDHWDGHAGDFGMAANHGTNDGPVGDKIAAAALRAAGVSAHEAAARVRKGGLWNETHNGMRIQVIWKTDVGGNHHDHVHIGAR